MMLKNSVRQQSEWQLVTPDEVPMKWDAYVERHSKGSVFHTVGMHRAYEQTPGNIPWSRAAIDADSNVVAMLNAVRVETLSGLASRMASRSILYCEPICDESPAGKKGLALLVREHDREMQNRVLFTEIRPLIQSGVEKETLIAQGHLYQNYLNYIVDLEREPDELERNLNKSCRKQIRKCQKRGVKIFKETTHDSIDIMYRMVQHSYELSRVPLADVQLFHHALDYLGDDVVEVRRAEYEGQVVSAGITLKFGNRIYAWYGGSLRVTGLAPFALLTWDEIESGSREGFKYYDFGGAGWPNEPYGPREFKAKFGGELVDFGRYRKIVSPWRLAAANGGLSNTSEIQELGSLLQT